MNGTLSAFLAFLVGLTVLSIGLNNDQDSLSSGQDFGAGLTAIGGVGAAVGLGELLAGQDAPATSVPTGAVTPEPAGYMILGLGVVSYAGKRFRNRKRLGK